MAFYIGKNTKRGTNRAPAFFILFFKNTMETITRQSAGTYAQFTALLESIPTDELKGYVLKLSNGYGLGYTDEIAGQFLEHLKEQEEQADNYDKGEFRTFKAYYLVGLMGSDGWRADDINQKTLKYYKDRLNRDREKKAKEWYDEKQKQIFKDAFIKYYKDQNEEELRKRVNLGYYRDNDAVKTKNKIDNKLKTKSHNLEKIEELINQEINDYWRHNHALLNEEERAEYWRIYKGAWFKE